MPTGQTAKALKNRGKGLLSFLSRARTSSQSQAIDTPAGYEARKGSFLGVYVPSLRSNRAHDSADNTAADIKSNKTRDHQGSSRAPKGRYNFRRIINRSLTIKSAKAAKTSDPGDLNSAKNAQSGKKQSKVTIEDVPDDEDISDSDDEDTSPEDEELATLDFDPQYYQNLYPQGDIHTTDETEYIRTSEMPDSEASIDIVQHKIPILTSNAGHRTWRV